MSFFTSSIAHTYTSELVIPPSSKSLDEGFQIGIRLALDMLQDFREHISLNPLVVRIDQLPVGSPKRVDIAKTSEDFDQVTNLPGVVSNWWHCEIQDELKMIGGFKKDLIYHLALRKLMDGIEGYTDAGSGVRIRGVWRVRQSVDRPDTIELVEDAAIKCPIWVAWYIKGTMGKSHETLHESFAKKWEERMKEAVAMF